MKCYKGLLIKSSFVPTRRLLKLKTIPLLLNRINSLEYEPVLIFPQTIFLNSKESRNLIAVLPEYRFNVLTFPEWLHSFKSAIVCPQHSHSSRKYNLFHNLKVGKS